jgi:hypothetical protein
VGAEEWDVVPARHAEVILGHAQEVTAEVDVANLSRRQRQARIDYLIRGRLEQIPRTDALPEALPRGEELQQRLQESNRRNHAVLVHSLNNLLGDVRFPNSDRCFDQGGVEPFVKDLTVIPVLDHIAVQTERPRELILAKADDDLCHLLWIAPLLLGRLFFRLLLRYELLLLDEAINDSPTDEEHNQRNDLTRHRSEDVMNHVKHNVKARG